MNNKNDKLFFWIGIVFSNLIILILTIFFQVLSYYGPMIINHEQEIQVIIHSLKMLAVGICLSLLISTVINYFAIKSKYQLFQKKVLLIEIVHFILNLAFATHLITETLNSSN